LPAGRPHVLGIDDAPFDKRQRDPVPIVAVMMEGCDLVEAIAVARFPVDGADATAFLAGWVGGLRLCPSLRAIVLGGITIAGLGVVDVAELAERLRTPVLVATRRRPSDAELSRALRAAGLASRVALVERAPRASRVEEGLYLAHAGIERGQAEEIARGTLRKARLPEPLRVAHLIGTALVKGASRGRV
jgi:endonuclease V-like protein UPF0215 family